jgi:hypothetical protein
MSALRMRSDHTPTVLRKPAMSKSNAHVARRILAIANVLDGMSPE